MTVKSTVLVIGCGNMGAALAAGYAQTHPVAEAVALDRDPQRAAGLLPAGAAIALHRSPEEIPGFRPDIVILAFKPQVLGDALATLLPLCAGALAISIAAGTPLARRQGLLGDHCRVVRAMQNLPVQVGAGMATLYAPGLDPADVAAVEAVFTTVGAAAWVASEALIDAATAVAGSGPAHFFAMVEPCCGGRGRGAANGIGGTAGAADLHWCRGAACGQYPSGGRAESGSLQPARHNRSCSGGVTAAHRRAIELAQS